MKTIEERAKEQANNKMARAVAASEKAYPKGIYIQDLRTAYANGYMQAEANLTEWHDPKEPPQDNRDVLLKIKSIDRIVHIVGFYDVCGWCRVAVDYTDDIQGKIIGWREIHE